MAIASGSRGAEAVVVLGGEGAGEADLAALRDFAGPGVPVHVGTPAGLCRTSPPAEGSAGRARHADEE